MYDSVNPVQSRRLPLTKSRSSISSGILKRHPSGHIPQLNANPRPLSNISNLPTKGKRSIDETVEYDVPTSNYASIRPQATSNPVKRTKTDPKKTNALPTDGSLHVITSTVQGMKHWTNKHLPYPMLFEIFGQLDSQVTSLSSSNTCQFSLIDEKDRLECLFAEIDQSFSHIDRDVQLRIICRLDSTGSLAHCLAIRVASPQEWQERRSVIKQCDLQLNDDDLQTKKKLSTR